MQAEKESPKRYSYAELAKDTLYDLSDDELEAATEVGLAKAYALASIAESLERLTALMEPPVDAPLALLQSILDERDRPC